MLSSGKSLVRSSLVTIQSQKDFDESIFDCAVYMVIRKFDPCAARELYNHCLQRQSDVTMAPFEPDTVKGSGIGRATTIVAKVLAGASGVRLKEIVQTET